jgi:hypothetical protein
MLLSLLPVRAWLHDSVRVYVEPADEFSGDEDLNLTVV